MRFFLTFAMFVASYMLSWFVLLLVWDLDGLALVVPWAVAGWVAYKVWNRPTDAPAGPLLSAVFGAALVGSAGFLLGFFGPMLLAPSANQGPMLGLFITGPLGLLAGAVGGFVVGVRRQQTEAGATAGSDPHRPD